MDSILYLRAIKTHGQTPTYRKQNNCDGFKEQPCIQLPQMMSGNRTGQTLLAKRQGIKNYALTKASLIRI